MKTTKKDEVYYIGLNANNAICNDNFFKGSITLYPTKEIGNTYYSSELILDTKSNDFMKKYKKFVYKTAKSIQESNKNARFLCFNDKIKKMCSDMTDINIINQVDENIINFLNNKFEIREHLKDIVPVMDYYFINNSNMNYKSIKQEINSDIFVLQGKTGAGGNNTYLIKNTKDFDKIEDLTGEYSVSKYVNHIPLNITMIVSKKDIIVLPISVQLIMLTDNKFKYVGGDFAYINHLDDSIINRINEYSMNIAKKVQQKGFRGVLGIDYILTEDNQIYFMEINPRFQSSSFLISLELSKYYNTSIAELNYLAIKNKRLNNIDLRKINKSFVNCNTIQQFETLKENSIVENGYFKDNKTSFYRKIFDHPIVNEKFFVNLFKK